jgi:hypothetical protein
MSPVFPAQTGFSTRTGGTLSRRVSRHRVLRRAVVGHSTGSSANFPIQDNKCRTQFTARP